MKRLPSYNLAATDPHNLPEMMHISRELESMQIEKNQSESDDTKGWSRVRLLWQVTTFLSISTVLCTCLGDLQTQPESSNAISTDL